MSWLFIILAGMLEVVVVIGVRLISKKKYCVGIITYLSAFAISLTILHYGMDGVDISIAYAAYTGIGVIGTVITGILLWGESRNFSKFIYIALIIMSIAALKAAN